MPSEYGLPSTKKIIAEEQKERVDIPGIGSVQPQGISVQPKPPPPGEAPLANRAPLELNELERMAGEQLLQPPPGVGAGIGGVGSLGGYAPTKLTLEEELKKSYEDATRSLGTVQSELAKFQADPRRKALYEERSKQMEQAVVDEEARAGRLKTLGTQQGDLTRDITQRMDEFKVDPNRLFGQGGQRAAANFALGIANLFSNVGEAMQGKAGTNAVLGLVRDRIAQDIALQENDYRRMLQGYEVRRNGLMDAIQMVGNERQGAEALARQQSLKFADQLDMLSRATKDAEARNVFAQAAATIRGTQGRDLQAIQTANVSAENQAKQFNAQLEAQRRLAEAQAQAASMSMYSLSKEDQERYRKQLDKADEAKLMQRSSGLREMRSMLQASPNVAAEAQGVIASFIRGVAQETDSTIIGQKLSQMAIGSLSPEGQNFVRAYQRYLAGRLTALGGKAITANEKALFNMSNYTSPAQFGQLLQEEGETLRNDALSIYKTAGLAGNAQRILARDLSGLYQGLVREPASIPEVK
jgi:hypothetical protein